MRYNQENNHNLPRPNLRKALPYAAALLIGSGVALTATHEKDSTPTNAPAPTSPAGPATEVYEFGTVRPVPTQLHPSSPHGYPVYTHPDGRVTTVMP
jgi:hypothetical protein